MLTVSGLIQLLSSLDPDLPVVGHGYEGGYFNLSKTRDIELVENYYDSDEWWYGPHEHSEYVKALDIGSRVKHMKTFKAVLVS